MSDPAAAPPEYPSETITDSRRLMGPNLFSARPGAVLEVCATDPARLAAWGETAGALAARLGWAEAETAARAGTDAAMLYLAAPVDALMTATEVCEQAWAALDSGRPVADDVVEALEESAAAEAGAQPRVAAVHAEARRRGVQVTFDDDSLTLGAGAGARDWPLGEVPSPDTIDWEAIGTALTVLVTGSNGKTTVTRLVSAIWTAAGRTAGYSCTDGVWVAGEPLASGDYSGPAGARTVLRDPRVQVAVLETARGGILRRGLACTRADAAVITNVSADHFGEYGVESLDALAEAKSVVARVLAPGGSLVLNAGDPTLVALGQRTAGRLAWFCGGAEPPMLASHLDAGGDAAVVREGRLLLHRGGWHDLGAVDELPLTLRGAAKHNVENLAAAALLAAVSGAPVEAIRDTVRRFGTSPLDNPGRLQVLEIGGATVLVDYAHNPEGLSALCEAAKAFPAQRRLLLLGQAGDRGDDLVRALIRSAWAVMPFDRVIVKEMSSLLRGRSAGEVPAVLVDELRRMGLPASAIEQAPSELEGVRSALDWARPGDLLVLPSHAQRVEVAAELDTRLSRP